MLIASPISDWRGMQAWFIIGRIVTLITGVATFFIPAVMCFEEGQAQAALVGDPTVVVPAIQPECT
jgi:hypothetical protein